MTNIALHLSLNQLRMLNSLFLIKRYSHLSTRKCAETKST